MSTDFDYSAFISYKREDEKWAKWLQNRLERYSIPTAIRREIPRLPKRIKPIFRDKTDLGVGGLSSSLHKELERSQFLIVICSPRSASSDWVGREIEHFRSLGREEMIIPFIVDGEPHSDNPESECFHPVFYKFKEEPLGVNIREAGKQQAMIKVLARILDLRFDVLWKRHERYERRRRTAVGAIACLTCLLGIAFWYYNRPMYKYYSDYVDVSGVPRGIMELDKETYLHRSGSYRFVYRRTSIWKDKETENCWRLSRVEFVNSAGQIQEDNDIRLNRRYAIQKLEYDNSSGNLKHIDFCNKYGKVLLRWKISDRGEDKAVIIDFLGVTEMDASGYHSNTEVVYPHAMRNSSRSPIKRYILTRDANGYITSISYHENNSKNAQLSKIADINGIHKEIFTTDSLGRRLSATYYDINGAKAERKDGVASECYEYDERGNMVVHECFDLEGAPVLNQNLYAKMTTEFDCWGNAVTTRYYGANGEPCYNRECITQQQVEFDDRGFPTSIAYLDINGNPCIGKNGCCKIHLKCDSEGRQIENRYEDISGQPCSNTFGVARVNVEYDRWGRPVHLEFHSYSGGLTKMSDGTSGWNADHDRMGNVTHIEFFDSDWNACACTNGYAGWEAEYNDRGDLTCMKLLDVHGKLAQCNDGYALFRNVYAENSQSTSYFDENDKPCITRDGFHKIQYIFDDYGNLLETSFYNDKNEISEAKAGHAIVRTTYDDRGNAIKIEHFDSDRAHIKVDGVEVIEKEYDRYGRATCVRFYNGDGVPTKNKQGIYGYEVGYDNRGEQISYRGFGADGKDCSGNVGLARWERRIDIRGNTLAYAAYGEDGLLTEGLNGVAAWEQIFNDNGLLLSTFYYGADGLPHINTDCGYARYETKYNEKFEQIEVTTYDDRGDLCIAPESGFARWKATYDDNGNKTEMLSFSDRDSLCVCNYGYARWVAEYDKDGCVIESTSYDENGNVIIEEVEAKKRTIVEVRKYDSHRFKYDTADIVFGFLFLFVLIVLFVCWIKTFSSNTIKDNLLWLGAMIALAGFDYTYLRRFLLHYSIVSYDFHNYSWVLYIASSISLLSALMFCVAVLARSIKPIFKASKKNRTAAIKESVVQILLLILGICWLGYAIYYILDDGWFIYSNPL